MTAFAKGSHQIDTPHVQEAMRDSQFKLNSRRIPGKNLIMGSVAATLLLVGIAAWWLHDQPQALIQQGHNDLAPHAVAAPQNNQLTLPSGTATNLTTAPEAASLVAAAPSASNNTKTVESTLLKLRLDSNLTPMSPIQR